MIEKNNPNNSKGPYIIAIGASAGGMEAIHLLFDHTPEDGVAYVIIQHLSPDHKSFMAELLTKHSKLQISIAEHEMPVEPNRVYLLPQGKNMTIKNRKLMLTDIKATQRNTSIDIFFDSLAQSLGTKSIAVILSGTGSDGTKGIAAIKKNGGYVIVQDPESAKFDGMPISAIQSGNADIVLPPELIPGEIINYLKRDVLESNFVNEISEEEENTLIRILHLIQKHTPLDFSDYKRPTLIRRIVIRMTKNKMTQLSAYADFLETNPKEVKLLAKEFLIGVTKFFRDKEAFEVIEKKVIPEIVENKLQVDTLKVWVVGCATGEEAYSIAILIMERLTELKKSLEIKIFASDIDKAALQQASKGIFPAAIEKDVSKERLDKFFTKTDNGYKIRENIRKMIIFADHDIVKQPPYGKIDLISCRNLLIYINPILQKKILASLHFCLNLGGYLFLGPSESLSLLGKSFNEVDKKWRIFKSIEVVRNLRDTTYSTPGLEHSKFNRTPDEAFQKKNPQNMLASFVNQSLLEVSGFDAGIWVDTDFEIKESYGNYEKFLLPKIFNFNLLETLPEALSIATSNTVRKALKSEKTAAIDEVKFKKNGIQQSVNVFVKPLLAELTSSQTLALVLFSENESEPSSNTDVETFEMEAQSTRYLEEMKEELTKTKQQLNDAYHALEVSNDNVSSYNEELISSNEEMQSTNEELQSVNEELQTVNNEYQLKIKELADLNDDLNNYFRSTISAQLYVDSDLVLRKFTPSAIRQINLKESDIGRLLSDISTNIRFSTLMDDINKVINSSITIDREVQTIDGRWYCMMAMPYLKHEYKHSDGVIITFHDITELKKAQDKLSRINADHNTFIYAVSHDLRGPLYNLNTLIRLLKDSVLKESKNSKELLDMIDKSTDNLIGIINELTDIAKIEHEIDLVENISIKEILQEVEASIKETLVKSAAKIVIDLDVAEVPFSKKNMRSTLYNLLNNAIKYRSPDRALVVQVSTEKSDGFTILSIKDNGLGIAEKEQNKVFGAFHRAHHHVEGSGMGLYLVKKTITNAGGDIKLESELGKGSVFRIFIPNKEHELSSTLSENTDSQLPD
jgi:two-component system CheB/CheR fusion protein